MFKYFFLQLIFLCLPLLAIARQRTEGIVVATWNIGHFSQGGKPNSVIKRKDCQKKREEFLRIIEDSIAADIFCVNEYSENFIAKDKGDKQHTAQLLFEQYPIQYEGEQWGFSCNSLFGKQRIRGVKVHEYKCNEAVIEKTPRAANYYYVTAKIRIGRKKVTLVCVHLISRDSQLRKAEAEELIERFRKSKRIVMCGDWNMGNYSQFKKAGYTMANNSKLVTFPSKAYPLDNIIVKGLNISEVRVIKTDLSDHYPLVCRITL